MIKSLKFIIVIDYFHLKPEGDFTGPKRYVVFDTEATGKIQ